MQKYSREYYTENLVKLRCLFPYRGTFKRILASYKFGKYLGVGNFLALCLNRALENISSVNLQDAAWVPVPPRPGKMKKQGWDQIDFLAGRLESEYKSFKNIGGCLPVSRCLKRLPSRSQKELNKKERESNLKGRINCTRRPPETAVLFDDVITTGATLNACAEALLEGGAQEVYGVCLFYD